MLEGFDSCCCCDSDNESKQTPIEGISIGSPHCVQRHIVPWIGVWSAISMNFIQMQVSSSQCWVVSSEHPPKEISKVVERSTSKRWNFSSLEISTLKWSGKRFWVRILRGLKGRQWWSITFGIDVLVLVTLFWRRQFSPSFSLFHLRRKTGKRGRTSCAFVFSFALAFIEEAMSINTPLQ